ncbi:MAG: M15 family metallopeptidase [Anaerorhabdus sp.]
MKILRIVFVISVLVVSTLCLAYMNSKYDSLSRYPYEGERTRAIIKDKLSRKEIEYIIEYSISPDLFMEFIEVTNFNIYHSQEYYDLRYILGPNNIKNFSPFKIVDMVEKTREFLTVKELGEYLSEYPFTLIEDWVKNGDEYSKNSQLVFNPSDIKLILDEKNSVSTYIPNDLVLLENQESEKIYLQKEAKNQFEQLCVAIEKDLEIEDCAGISISKGFISYNSQKEIYLDFKEKLGNDALKVTDYPGHSDHQLGLAIDISINGVLDENIEKSIQYQWLLDNMHEYGFVQPYQMSNSVKLNKAPNFKHYRYIGKSTASKLYNESKIITDLSE